MLLGRLSCRLTRCRTGSCAIPSGHILLLRMVAGLLFGAKSLPLLCIKSGADIPFLCIEMCAGIPFLRGLDTVFQRHTRMLLLLVAP